MSSFLQKGVSGMASSNRQRKSNNGMTIQTSAFHTRPNKQMVSIRQQRANPDELRYEMQQFLQQEKHKADHSKLLTDKNQQQRDANGWSWDLFGDSKPHGSSEHQEKPKRQSGFQGDRRQPATNGPLFATQDSGSKRSFNKTVAEPIKRHQSPPSFLHSMSSPSVDDTFSGDHYQQKQPQSPKVNQGFAVYNPSMPSFSDQQRPFMSAEKQAKFNNIQNGATKIRTRCTSFGAQMTTAFPRVQSKPHQAVYSKSDSAKSDDELDKRQTRFYADTSVKPEESWPEPDDIAPPPEEWLFSNSNTAAKKIIHHSASASAVISSTPPMSVNQLDQNRVQLLKALRINPDGSLRSKIAVV